MLKRQVEKSHADAYALLSAAKLPTLPDYLATVVKRGDDSSGEEAEGSENPDEGGVGDSEIVGPAAAAILDDTVALAPAMESPSKPRPPVPPFSASSSSSPQASLHRGRWTRNLSVSEEDEVSDDGSQPPEGWDMADVSDSRDALGG